MEKYLIESVVIFCYCIGFIIKKWVKVVDNKYIPTLVGVLGVFFAIWSNNWSVTPDTILIGLVSGLASTGADQFLKIFKRG